MLSFSLGRKSWVDRFLERLFHDRKAVESDIDATPTFRRRLWQASVYRQQCKDGHRQNQSSISCQPHESPQLYRHFCSGLRGNGFLKELASAEHADTQTPLLTLLDFTLVTPLG